MTLMATIQDWCPWCGQHMGWWGWGGMVLGWIIVLAAILGLFWLVLRQAGPRAGDRGEDLLRERFARGEIDDETYQRMLTELRRR